MAVGPKLFFARLACNGWKTDAIKCIQRVLISLGWVMLPFELPVGQGTKYGRARASATWFDPNHPRLDLATDIVCGLIKKMEMKRGDKVLLLGDSTISYCIDSYSGEYVGNRWVSHYDYAAREAMVAKILAKTGVHLYHYGVSGSAFGGRNGFQASLNRATKNSHEYQAILLVGGWNEAHQSLRWMSDLRAVKQYLKPMLTEFTTACKAAICSGVTG